jgi:hypothetical protein
VGLYLRGLGLPSQLEQEDWATLQDAQARLVAEQERQEKEQWARSVRQQGFVK